MSDVDVKARAVAQEIKETYLGGNGISEFDIDMVAAPLISAALSTEKAAREAAEKRVGELEAQVTQLDDAIDLNTSHRLAAEERELRALIAKGEAEAALAPLQALVDEARKVIEPLLTDDTWGVALLAALNGVSGGGLSPVTIERLRDRERAAQAWLSATPTDLLNERLAEVPKKKLPHPFDVGLGASSVDD